MAITLDRSQDRDSQQQQLLPSPWRIARSMSAADIQSIAPGGWLTDNVVLFGLSTIQHNHLRYIDTIYFMEPIVAIEVMQSMRHILADKDIVFIPVNDGDGEHCEGSHWSLLVYVIARNEFYHFDSLEDRRREDNPYIQNVIRVCQHIRCILVPGSEVPDLDLILKLAPAQMNGKYIDRLYLLMFAKAIAERLEVTYVSIYADSEGEVGADWEFRNRVLGHLGEILSIEQQDIGDPAEFRDGLARKIKHHAWDTKDDVTTNTM
ncbi:SUMO1 sentrin specific peptidase 8 [Spiromyces aspiralis]|uniref:SUMO1 sentrin specific peptidase 8 n=1 Tax=Spiromyces aspiralis TaxID=68401 RepID=A0ACC1HRT8_9FUNG|nr:SUMO1 sentrin specific peptidase 8 [Spiromyces aspiralis]